MAKLRVPSLQHLARNWRNEPHSIKRLLVELAENSPIFSYSPLFGAVRDMLVFRQPYEQIEEGLRRGIKRAEVRQNLLGVLPLIRDHFKGVNPTFVQSVDRRFYPVGRDLMVPFDPPLIYGDGGQIQFPWFMFWRSNPLVGERLSLFVSLVEDVLLQDPDLEDVNFTILDFSSPSPKQPRALEVIDAKEVPRVSDKAKVEMLSTFAEGYRLAEAHLAEAADVEPKGDRSDQAGKDQPGMFDRDS